MTIGSEMVDTRVTRDLLQRSLSVPITNSNGIISEAIAHPTRTNSVSLEFVEFVCFSLSHTSRVLSVVFLSLSILTSEVTYTIQYNVQYNNSSLRSSPCP